MQTENATKSSAGLIPIRIAVSESGVKTNQLRNEELTFDELCSRLERRPPVGTKDGSYFLRGPLKDDCDTRSNANVDEVHLIILDGDKSVSPKTGGVSEGAPDPEAVHIALKRLGVPHVIYTTHSHQKDGKGNKFRVLIPVAPTSLGLVAQYVEHFCNLLREQEIHLANVAENNTISQPWYFPRLTDENQDYQCYAYTEPPPLDLTGQLPKPNEEPVPMELPEMVGMPCPTRDEDSLPGKYNAMHGSVEQMTEMLIRHGYERAGTAAVNGRPAPRFLCPGSTTGNPGAMLFSDDNGRGRFYSHHGSDPLNEGDPMRRAKDAFDLFRILEHGGDTSAAMRSFQTELDPRPIIEYAPGETHNQLPRVCELLVQQEDCKVFQRGESLVHIAHSPERQVQDGVELPTGTASIRPYKKTTLALELSERFQFGKFTKNNEWIPTDPFGPLVSAMLDAYGKWRPLPVLRGISENRILLDDGALSSDSRYDPETQLYVEGGMPPIQLPDTVSHHEALAALEIVLSPFREFPFVDKDLGRACVLAYMLTLLLRALIKTAPMFIFSATSPGTGKGLLVELANTIIRGRDAALMPPVRGKEGQEEMRKRLTSVIAHGITSLNIDNCSQPLGGDALNAVLTTGEWTDRQLGSNQVIKLPVCLTLAATGNNLGVRGDMVRRSILLQLDALVERPEARVFEERDPIGAAKRRRPELLQALFIILKGYQQSGCTDFRDDRLGRFEAWSERVCHPIQWLGLPNPTNSQALLREEDPEFDNLNSLFQAWYGIHQDAWVSTKDLIDSSAGNYGRPNSEGAAETLEAALVEVAGERGHVDAKRLGWFLKRNQGRVAGGLRLERQDKGGRVGNHGHRYRLVPVQTSDSSTDS